MNFELEQDDSRAMMRGEFTFADHVGFRALMARLFRDPDRGAVIDLSGLEFIDSAGLGMLLIARDEAAKANVRLVLHRPQGQVRRMFDVTQFATLFTIES